MQLFIFTFLLIAYFVLHSILAAHRVKRALVNAWISGKYYRLAFNAIAIVTLLPIAYSFIIIKSPFLFDSKGTSVIGLVLLVVGIALLLYALSQYNLSEFSGIEQLKTNTSPSPQNLKTTGFNSLVRHPLYFAGLIIIWGGFLYSPSVKFLVVSLIATLYLYFGTKLEEQKLLLEFGEEYRSYRKKVGMLIPWLK